MLKIVIPQNFGMIQNNPGRKGAITKIPGSIATGDFRCWTTKIRTWANRTKTCCATITP